MVGTRGTVRRSGLASGETERCSTRPATRELSDEWTDSELEDEELDLDDEQGDENGESDDDSDDVPQVLMRRNGLEFVMEKGKEYDHLRGELDVIEGDGLPASLWDYFGRKDVGHIKRDEGGQFVVYFCGDQHNDAELRLFDEEEMLLLFGMQITRFAKDDACKELTPEMACRLRLSETFDDECSYNECPQESWWNICTIWLSKGEEGEEAGNYYCISKCINGKEVTNLKFRIDLYSFVQWGDVKDELAEGLNECDEGVLFWTGKKSQVSAVIEIDNWCLEHVGRRLKVNYARS